MPRLLARIVNADYGELRSLFEGRRLLVWLIRDPNRNDWSDKAGKIVELKLEKIKRIEKLPNGMYVIDYNSSHSFYNEFATTDERGEEVTKLEVYGVDADEIGETMKIERVKGGWKLTYIDDMTGEEEMNFVKIRDRETVKV